MASTVRAKAPANSEIPAANPTVASLKTEVPRQGGLFQTVVFSRKNTSHGPDDIRSAAKGSPSKKQLADLTPNPLANIVHQADRSGKQATALSATNARASTASTPRQLQRGESESASGQGSFRNLFANIWSALGISEQQAAAQKANGSSPSKTKAGSSRNVVELRKSVLPPLSAQDAGKKCLVLDLDETLVHSSFKPTPNPDYIIPVDIDGTVHQVYVCLRPGAEEFLIEMAKHYEIVIYTASLSKYADPLLDRLDPMRVIRYRLFREHCVQYEGNYVKDLSLLDRDITQTIIIDNSPMSYLFHPRNAIGCSSFIDDMNDRELDSIARFLTNIRAITDFCPDNYQTTCKRLSQLPEGENDIKRCEPTPKTGGYSVLAASYMASSDALAKTTSSGRATALLSASAAVAVVALVVVKRRRAAAAAASPAAKSMLEDAYYPLLN